MRPTQHLVSAAAWEARDRLLQTRRITRDPSGRFLAIVPLDVPAGHR